MFNCSDATLITLRFHFSPVPHASRHVLGWYHLIKELRQSGVQPICVFDGTQRSVAKKAEVRSIYVVFTPWVYRLF
jgi:flap endonuclease-1